MLDLVSVVVVGEEYNDSKSDTRQSIEKEIETCGWKHIIILFIEFIEL